MSATGIPRVVGIVSYTGEIDTTTALTNFTAPPANNFRGAASDDCQSLWLTSSGNGTVHAAFNADPPATAFTPIAAVPDARNVAIFDGQLYISSNAGTDTYKGISRVGDGLPQATAAVARLPGLSDALTGNPYGFFFADLDGQPGLDTLYVANNSGLLKFTLDGGVWGASGSITTAGDTYYGLTGVVDDSLSPPEVTLYATRNTNTLVKAVDASGHGGALTGTPTVLATAGTNQVFRGVALAPEMPVTATASMLAGGGTVSPESQTVGYGEEARFTVTPDSGYNTAVGGTCEGTLDGTVYTTLPLTQDCTVEVTFTTDAVYTVTPSATPVEGGSITPRTPRTVAAGGGLTLTIAANQGYDYEVTGSCDGALTGDAYTITSIQADCEVVVELVLQSFAVTPSAGANGSIDPAGVQAVNYGDSLTFTVVPDANHQAVMGGSCGGQLDGETYVTAPIIADCAVEAAFEPLPQYDVTINVVGHGSVRLDGAIAAGVHRVYQGQGLALALAPDEGYAVAARGSCAGAVVGGHTYVIDAVQEDCSVDVRFAKEVVLFVGNSFTHARVMPAVQYNWENVSDLTLEMWLENDVGSHEDSPHPWGGIPGIFKKFTEQAGLDYDVSISARSAASLRGHYLNSNPAGWDLRGNVGSQHWTTVVLQDLSDQPLPEGRGHNANLPYFHKYADKFQAWIHQGDAETYTEDELFAPDCPGITGASVNNCAAQRVIPENRNANADAKIYLYQTWARADLIAPNGTNANGTTYTEAEGLEEMTKDFEQSYFERAVGNPAFEGVSPVGNAYLRAVQNGVAVRDPYTELDKLSLWWLGDYFHSSKYGAYLSGLVHFGRITGIDPLSLGAGELAAIDLAITPAEAVALQQAAHDVLVPKAPSITAVQAGDGAVTVAFAPPEPSPGTRQVLDFLARCGDVEVGGQTSPLVVDGLENGQAVQCVAFARNSIGLSEASESSAFVTPEGSTDPGAAVCGTAVGRASLFAPVEGLCEAGQASSVVSGSGHYSWTCTAAAGSAACTAPWALTPGGNTTASVAMDAPTEQSGWRFTRAELVAPPVAPPQDVEFPFGLLDVVLEGGVPGSAATITITYAEPVADGAVYWKWGSSPEGHGCSGAACAQPHWYPLAGAVLAGHHATFTIVDGGLGDDDGQANGVIIDPGGPGVAVRSPAPPSSAAPIPTLSHWALVLLIGLLGGAVALHRRTLR